jgi:F-type H+-transporting ATPase subunit gamma
MVEREAKNIAFVVVSTDRGLCGGLNMNTFRTTVRAIKEWKDKGADARFSLIGNKAQSFFRRVGGKPLASAAHLGDKPHLEQLIGLIKATADAYRNGEVDRVFLVSSKFVNTMTQKPEVRQLLPLPAAPADQSAPPAAKSPYPWDYIYEPGAVELLDTVLQRYIESQVYQAVVENAACEQSARMVAMKSASDNAGKIISQLQLAYNKARQASITKELAEIVGGAAAVG